jgi:hypothetical protein
VLWPCADIENLFDCELDYGKGFFAASVDLPNKPRWIGLSAVSAMAPVPNPPTNQPSDALMLVDDVDTASDAGAGCLMRAGWGGDFDDRAMPRAHR